MQKKFENVHKNTIIWNDKWNVIQCYVKASRIMLGLYVLNSWEDEMQINTNVTKRSKTKNDEGACHHKIYRKSSFQYKIRVPQKMAQYCFYHFAVTTFFNL